MTTFLSDIVLAGANDIQFKNTSGTNTGKISSDGNNLVLSNAVGDILLGDGASDVYIGDGTNNVDILFEQSGSIKAEDGSSGVTLTLGSSDTTLALGSSISSTLTVGVDDTGYDVKFFGATSGKYLMWDESQDRLEFADTTYAAFGTDGDMLVYHTGTDGFITEKTGHLYIRTQADDKDVILQSDDGSGGTTAYLTLDGSEARMNAHKDLRFDDNEQLQLGAGADMQIYHNGSTSVITNQTGNILIRNQTDDGDIVFQADDGSGGDTTYLTLNGGEGQTVADVDINFRDNVKASFGNLASGDLRISHDTTDSLINNYTGDLYIRNNADDKDIIFQSDDGSGGVTAYLTLDGGFRVYHGSEANQV